MTFLLDVNVLIALIDPLHIAHSAAHKWFTEEGAASWATCPMTESGVMRIVGYPKYPNTPGSPVIVATILSALRLLPGYVFWPDDISLLDATQVDASQLLTSGHITDSYLLALAASHSGKLATFDRRLSSKSVRNGKDSLKIIAG